MHTAQALQHRGQLLGHLAFIEGRTTFAGDAAQRLAESGLTALVANGRSNAGGQEMLFRSRIAFKARPEFRPVRSNPRRDAKTVFRSIDGWLQNFFERLAAMTGGELAPGIDRAWNRDALDGGRREILRSLRHRRREIGLGRRPAG